MKLISAKTIQNNVSVLSTVCIPPLSKFYITFTFFAQKPRCCIFTTAEQYSMPPLFCRVSFLVAKLAGSRGDIKPSVWHRVTPRENNLSDTHVCHVKSNRNLQSIPPLKILFLYSFVLCLQTYIYLFFSLASFWHSEVLKHVLQ